MNTRIVRRIVGALLLLAALGASSACLATYDEGGLAVSLAPPPVRVDARLAAPGPGYIWISGYWDWGGGDWAWVPGTWVREPHPHAAWVVPRYRQRHGHWYYSRGHWR